ANRLEQPRRGELSLLVLRLRDRGERRHGESRGRAVVEAHDRELARHGHAELRRRLQGPDGEDVAHREDGGRRTALAEEVERPPPGGLGGVRTAGANERVVPRSAEALLVAGEPLDAHVERELALTIEGRDEREHADAAVAEPAQVLGGLPRG